MNRILYPLGILFTLAILLTSCGGTSENKETETAKEVNVYTHRHYEIDKQLFKEFTTQTGIKVNVITAGADQLMERLQREGENSPADLLITVDAGRLFRAKEKQLLQAITSPTLTKQVPTAFKDRQNYWYALTIRGRVVVYSKERVNPEELTTYSDLTNKKWLGKILVRSSDNIYNQSLMAGIIAHEGEEKALIWAKGIVANMARSPKGKDRDQMKAIAAGEGDLAIVNTYYLGKLLYSDKPEEQEVAKQLGVFFPNQEGAGTHINISGAGVTKYAPNKENAIKLLEFLTNKEAQIRFAAENHEYPVNTEAMWSEMLKKLGTFKADSIDFDLLGKHNTTAVKLFDQAGWK